MEGDIYEEFEVVEISKESYQYNLKKTIKKVISEISLKIIVNGEELVSLLCLNQCQEELALGFLYNEGVIHSFSDIQDIYYNEPMLAVIVRLKAGVQIDKLENLRSITSGCGKCYTYINPLKKNLYKSVENRDSFNVSDILRIMKGFGKQSELFAKVGGIHSVLFYTSEYQILNEDIGRHNCFDKIAGILLKAGKLELTKSSIIFVSGRVSSEIITKVIRLGSPVLVSKSTPTAAAVRLAQQYGVSLLGYVRDDHGYIYTCPERVNQ